MGLKTGTKENFGQKYFQFQQIFSIHVYRHPLCISRCTFFFVAKFISSPLSCSSLTSAIKICLVGEAAIAQWIRLCLPPWVRVPSTPSTLFNVKCCTVFVIV